MVSPWLLYVTVNNWGAPRFPTSPEWRLRVGFCRWLIEFERQLSPKQTLIKSRQEAIFGTVETFVHFLCCHMNVGIVLIILSIFGLTISDSIGQINKSTLRPNQEYLLFH